MKLREQLATEDTEITEVKQFCLLWVFSVISVSSVA